MFYMVLDKFVDVVFMTTVRLLSLDLGKPSKLFCGITWEIVPTGGERSKFV